MCKVKKFLKFKNLFFVTFLAVAGFFSYAAVSANIKSGETPVVEKAEATDNARFYFIKNNDWGWSSLKLHYWGPSGGPSWDSDPSLTATSTSVTRGSVTGTLYYYDIPADTEGVIVRGRENNQDKQTTNYYDWDPTGNNAAFFDHWDSGQNKGVLGATQYKNTNPSSSTNVFYVYDPHTNMGSTLANVNVYGYGETDVYKSMDWPGTHSGVTGTTLGITPVYRVALSTTYPNAIINCGNGNNQTENLEGTKSVANNVGKVLVIKNSHSGKVYDAYWENASVFNGSGNYPASEGYYLVKSTNSYSFTSSTKMSSSSDPYVAQLLNFSATKDLGIKVRGFYNDRDNPNIWSFYNGDAEAFGSADGDGNFIFSKNITVDIYAKYVSGELKFYVLEHVEDTGYYILGDEAFASDHGSTATPWTFASGLKMNTLSGPAGSNRASYVLTVSKQVEIRIRECLSLDHGWLDFGTTYDDDNLKTNGKNVIIRTAGSYTLYVNSSGAAYIMKGIPLDAFCTDFLTTIHDVCKMDGSTTEIDLLSAWSRLSAKYGNVLSSEKQTIVDIGFNGGSDVDDTHRVVLAYHYIVTKYGTAKCNDFIWGQNISGRSAIPSFSPFNLITDDENNVPTIIIIASSSVALLSVTALSILVIKKRKRKEQ